MFVKCFQVIEIGRSAKSRRMSEHCWQASQPSGVSSYRADVSSWASVLIHLADLAPGISVYSLALKRTRRRYPLKLFPGCSRFDGVCRGQSRGLDPEEY